MKILFLTDDFPPYHKGGAGQMAFDLAKELAIRNHQVFVLTTVQEKLKEEDFTDFEGLKIIRIYSKYHERWRAYRSLYNPSTIKIFKKVVQQIKPDVIHAHNIHYHLSYYCLKLSKKYSKAVFLTFHDVMAVHYGKWLPKNCNDLKINLIDKIKAAKLRYNPLRNLLIRHYLSYADKLFTVSKRLEKILNINGIENIITIYNSIKTETWTPDNNKINKLRIDYNLIGKKVILFGGRLSREKGIYQVFEIFKKVLLKEKNVVLLIFGGEKTAIQEFQKEAEEMNIASNIIFSGFVQREDLKFFYHCSDICLFPSLCFESFGMPCIESAAAKKPIIATCFGGPIDIIIDEETGYIINPYQTIEIADKIISLLNNQKRLKEMGMNNFQRIRDLFNFEKQVSDILFWYNKKY